MMNELAMILGYAVMVVMALAALWAIVSAICSRVESNKDGERLRRFLGILNEYERWLGYDFPQMAWLVSVLHYELVHGVKKSMDEIRQEARTRFAKYNPEPDRSLVVMDNPGIPLGKDLPKEK